MLSLALLLCLPALLATILINKYISKQRIETILR